MKKSVLNFLGIIDVILIIVINHFFDSLKWMSILLFAFLFLLALLKIKKNYKKQ